MLGFLKRLFYSPAKSSVERSPIIIMNMTTTTTAALLFLGGTLTLPATTTAGTLPQHGDFYLISRDRGGQFVGSHKLFLEDAQGLSKVTYCDRDYFVRSFTVAWTQVESERGHTVQLEFNFGRGWRPICREPEQQVTLDDLGIAISPQELLQIQADTPDPQSRLSAIGALFQTSRDETSGSYHSK